MAPAPMSEHHASRSPRRRLSLEWMIELMGMGGAIMAAGDAITQREARERARMKLEEVLAGVVPPSGGGSFEDAQQLKWSVKAEPVTVGLPDQGGQSQVRVVTLELTYPTNARGEEEAEGSEKITLAGIMAMDEGQ